MDQRKIEEREFHNKLRSDELKKDQGEYQYLTSNKKYYSIDKLNKEYVFNWLEERCSGKKVLDYCCGYGDYTFLAAEYGAAAYGIDISDVTIKTCQEKAREKGLADKTFFYVMDAEKMTFPDNFFDFILCMGVLHHLDFKAALRELSRVLKPDGKIICTEALGHNPIIQYYRRLTPHLRTAYETEHIIKMSDLKAARTYFDKVETRFFHLMTLAAVPLRNTRYFNLILNILKRIDQILLKIPLLRTQAWMVVFKLSGPKK